MLKKIFYILWILVLGFLIVFGLKNGSYKTFISSMENRSFDIRQSYISSIGLREHNKNIVIVAIDDASYEYILEKYGEWPLDRSIYAKLTDYIEAQSPKSIAFDLMFVKSVKSSANSDKALIDIFKKYNNVYTAMNLDNQEVDLRKPAILPEKLALNINNKSKKVDTKYYEFANCRSILDGILNSTKNIGMINVLRGDDGVLRQMPLFLNYNGKYYPQLALKVALNSLGLNDKKDFEISKKGELILGNKKIPVNKDGSITLNWYGGAETFEHIPLYKLIKAMEGDKNYKFNFKDKIVYFGATVSSLSDIKTVPVDRVYPGVEVQTTYVNNILDNNLIKKISPAWNIVIIMILAVLTIAIVLLLDSMPVILGSVITIYFVYLISAYYFMIHQNLWLEVVSPVIFIIIAFIITVIVKYLIKSRDFDKQYKLATTDGLTELYNHRYFQEQMQMFCSNAKRYESVFSLIILDIDFFKKFNDNFGHQSGDAVLRQVAFTLKKNVRSSDIVCRYGGEEMSIILPNAKEDEAVSIAQKLCNIVASQKFKLSNNRESNVTISLGVATYGQTDGTEPAKIIESADKRLYHAKENGRNRVN
ncbi:diguanylate cyclase [bacterium]|nr:diguanylate cyclase [bacterium]